MISEQLEKVNFTCPKHPASMHTEATDIAPEPIRAGTTPETVLLKFSPFPKILSNLVNGRHPTPPEWLSRFEYFLQMQFHMRIAHLVDKKHGPSAVERMAKDGFSKLPIEERDSLEANAVEIHHKELQQYEDQLKDIYGFQNESKHEMCVFRVCERIQHGLINSCQAYWAAENTFATAIGSTLLWNSLLSYLISSYQHFSLVVLWNSPSAPYLISLILSTMLLSSY